MPCNTCRRAGGELLGRGATGPGRDGRLASRWSRVSRQDFEARYRNEFLNGEGFRRFDEARDRLLDLLELPGCRPGIRHGHVGLLRLPYRAVRTWSRRRWSARRR